MTTQLDDRSPNINESTRFFQTNDNWQVWNKPKSCTFIYMMALGAGGGGGGGACQPSAVTTGGGGGGGGGAVIQTMIPAVLLPDVLYIRTGLGGSGGLGGVGGGSSAASGGTGGDSYVCIAPDTLLGNIICRAKGAKGGTGGLSGVKGYFGDSSGPYFNVSSTFFANLGICFGGDGRRGAIGGLGADEQGVEYYGGVLANHCFAAGGGGGAGVPTGEAWTANAYLSNYATTLMPESTTVGVYTELFGQLSGAVSSSHPTGRGRDGFGSNYQILVNNYDEVMTGGVCGDQINASTPTNQGSIISSGGTGGAAGRNVATSGNHGGNGGPGSGGGGGGGSRYPTLSNGGNGGRGGDGYVFIQCL